MPVALVTRPREDSQGVAAELGARGLDVVVEPLLDIRDLDAAPPDLTGVQGILATSANGVRALARLVPERGLKVWAVGDASARVARDLGYGDVEAAGGDVDSLAELVASRCDPAAGAFLHAAGTVLAGDLSALLGRNGFEVRRLVLYEAVTAESLSDPLKERLEGGGIDVALFFSPRTAATFVTLAKAAGLGETLARVTAYALSANVARELSSLGWRAVREAATPTQAALLAALDEDLKPGRPMTQSDTTEPAKEQPAPEPVAETPEPPPAAEPASSGRRMGLIVAAVIVLAVIIGAVAAWPLIEERFVARAPQAPVAAADEGLGDEIAILRGEVERLSRRVEALETRAPAGVQSSVPAREVDLGPVEARLERLEGAIRTLAARPELPADLPETVKAIQADLAELRRSAADAASVLRLSTRIEQMESELRQVRETRGSAAATLIAVGQLREAVNSAMPFESELRTVRALAPAGLDAADEVAALKGRAASGIPTRQDLVRRFDRLAPDVVRAEILPQGQGWWRDTLARLSTLVTIRREDGETAGTGTAALVARAEDSLARADLAGAVEELQRLQGGAAEKARPWLDDARARLAADRALSEMTAETLAVIEAR